MNPRLLQLASPALPVGAYSYSQGLEAAVDAGIVRDAAGAHRWIGEVFDASVLPMEAPILSRAAHAWSDGDPAAALRWNEEFVASRETAELRAETLQMGYSLRGLLRDLGVDCGPLEGVEDLAYPVAFAFAAAAWKIAPREALAAYLFAWIENQALAALKCVPLGQTDAQRIIGALGERIAAGVERAMASGDEELANFAPGLAILSSRHETQYSRIFRS